MPPETLSDFSNPLSEASTSELPTEDSLMGATSWDVATRYHEFKSRPISEAEKRNLRKLSVSAILIRAKQVLGSVVHPMDQKHAPLSEVPALAEQIDFDLEETLEHSPVFAGLPLTESDIWMSYSMHRSQPLVLSVDTSLSMTGEKLALTAVALAVVLLEFPNDAIGIVAFENEAMILKRPEEKLTVPGLIERFLDVPAQGYTHLEEGIRSALGLVRAMEDLGKPASTVLVTDGKYTAGKDPAYLAGRFPHLVVLKMGSERSSLSLCQELAQKGHGVVREVTQLEALPSVMYGIVKDLLRGRSLA